jgi:hypothetical protein
MRLAIKAAIAALALSAATPALALDAPVSPCDATLTNPDALDCAGYYSGNLINGSEEDRADQAAALALLGYGDLFDGSEAAWDALDPQWKIVATEGDSPVDFGVTLFGINVIGAHFGNVPGDAGNVSVFWVIDFGEAGGTLTLDDATGWSNAVLYTPPGVPEPATWAMMLLGFGAAGTALRRSRRSQTRLAQLA